MGYLFLSIICSSSIALIFKHSETSGRNRYAVTAANYLIAVVLSIVLTGTDGLRYLSDINVHDVIGEIGQTLADNSGPLSVSGSAGWAVMIGLGAGLFFFLGFVFYQQSVREFGAGLSGAFAKLGILVPMTLSLLFWREIPTVVQWCGIVLAVASIVIVNVPTDGAWRKALRPVLLLLFLSGGVAEFSNKLYQQYGLQDHKTIFLMVTFGVALILSLGAMIRTGKRVTGKDIVTGVAVGIPNLFSSYFLIQALEKIPATVAFPIFTAGSILFINVVGWVVFKERLSSLEKIAVGVIVLALILVNL
jgi:multidrug transporter EmrE-like cation transporter